jgi:hypothetical protein
MSKPGGDPSSGMSFSFDTLVATASSEAIAFYGMSDGVPY